MMMMTRIAYATGAKDDPASPTFRYLGPARLLATFNIFMIHVSITFPSNLFSIDCLFTFCSDVSIFIDTLASLPLII